MTKTVIQLFLFIFFSYPGISGTANLGIPKYNYIDSIQNARQIYQLLTSINNRYYGNFKINEQMSYIDRLSGQSYQSVIDSIGLKAWYKGDLDHNGLTDLLVVGSCDITCDLVVFDMGDRYEIHNLSKRYFQQFSFPAIENNGIVYYIESEVKEDTRRIPGPIEKLPLKYMLEDFIEKNNNVTMHTIEKIEYKTSDCLGVCPVFNLVINEDRTANWKADLYNKINGKEVKGEFTTTISESSFKEIKDLLNYINFDKLSAEYSVNWTDDQTLWLTITYDNGKIKTIQDYGGMGSFGLNRLYRLLNKLRETQRWK